MKTRLTCFMLAVCAVTATVHAEPVVEQPKITLAAAGVGLPYLPFVIAQSRGYFKQQGLTVEIAVYSGGAKALQALLGGSADVVAGAYSNTISLAPKGQKLVSFVTQAVCPGFVFGVTKSSHDKIKTYADLKGKRIGVSSPGSSFHMGVNYLLSRAGVKPDEVSIIGVGSSSGAIAAARNGMVDAIMTNDPVATVLEDSGDLFPLAQMRNAKDTQAVLGGNYPEASIYSTKAFVDKNPKTVQAIANAVVAAEKWMAGATPEQVANAVPREYSMADKSVFEKAYLNMHQCLSKDGMMASDAPKTVRSVLAAFDPAVASANIDLNATYDNRYVERADKP